jgi:phosphoenolpyruvate synthase/pyruvate phosphate dikinase
VRESSSVQDVVRYVLELGELDRAQVALVGGKAAHLGELSRIEGVRVPPGFCVSTDAFRRSMADAPSVDARLDGLALLQPDDREAIRTLSAELRAAIEAVAIPDELGLAIAGALARLGAHAAYAVRSSATAEDLPTASFAGQQDTYLNVVGAAEIIRHVSRCWASLFTERAVTYRLRHGIDHRRVRMAVVVQRMLAPQASGILFTADPVTGNRRVTSIEATFGLGEALVSGLVNADVYTVRDGAIVARQIGEKQIAIVPAPSGGTEQRAVGPERATQPALTDAQVVQLAQLGRRIEAHFGRPQDIEWCLADGEIQIVQSRPITTLFPVPETDDGGNHVYISVGHQQMMTDPMKPLGLSFWQMTTPRPMAIAGGRLFVDVTEALAAPVSRAGLLQMLGTSDPLIGDAMRTILARSDFLPTLSEDAVPWVAPSSGPPGSIEADPAIVEELIERTQVSIAESKRAIRDRSGRELLDFIRTDIQELRRVLFDPRSRQAIMLGMEATWWLNEKLHEWLGERNAADVLTQSVPHNVTSEMGLALLDVADAIRPHPEVVAFLRRVADTGTDDGFLDRLPEMEGGREAHDAIRGWLEHYGMRCVGEIDITRTRWSERPAALLPILLANVENFEPGEAARRFERGRQEAAAKERELLARLRALPDGEAKAEETKRMIHRVRTFAGFREYPKYGMIARYFVYKQALLAEAERLARAGAIGERDDIYYLDFEELRDVVITERVDRELIRQRREAFIEYQALTPPRVLTSDGEAVSGTYRRDDLPSGALVGLAVSAGVIEGRARVILDMSEADLEPGDILVTAFTDPSWTPLFVTIAGLVTEVGGLMTHGAVIAREYGLPAVVGVEHATRLIRDGQRIRVHGTEGYVSVVE